MLTTGWLALVLGVARAPTLAELTFFGAGFFTSGAWPWNLVALVSAGWVAVMAAAALVAAAEALLLRPTTARPRDAARILVVSLICALPAAFALIALAVGIAAVAPAEFTSPQDGGGTLVRVAMGVMPLIVLAVVASLVGSALHAAAARRAVRESSVFESLRTAPATLARGGIASLLQVAVLALIRAGYLVVAALLLRVLWDPIGARIGAGGFDPAAAFLLVGFVAIWLCLVLGGGALQAIGSVSWTSVLEMPPAEPMPGPTGLETPARP